MAIDKSSFLTWRKMLTYLNEFQPDDWVTVGQLSKLYGLKTYCIQQCLQRLIAMKCAIRKMEDRKKAGRPNWFYQITHFGRGKVDEFRTLHLYTPYYIDSLDFETYKGSFVAVVSESKTNVIINSDHDPWRLYLSVKADGKFKKFIIVYIPEDDSYYLKDYIKKG